MKLTTVPYLSGGLLNLVDRLKAGELGFCVSSDSPIAYSVDMFSWAVCKGETDSSTCSSILGRMSQSS